VVPLAKKRLADGEVGEIVKFDRVEKLVFFVRVDLVRVGTTRMLCTI
jgi:hypothetical protein